MEKNVLFRALPKTPQPLPPWPQFEQLGPFFRTSKFKIWKSLKGRGGRYINNLKKQLKGQYIGIFEEIDSFYWPKMR